LALRRKVAPVALTQIEQAPEERRSERCLLDLLADLGYVSQSDPSPDARWHATGITFTPAICRDLQPYDPTCGTPDRDDIATSTAPPAPIDVAPFGFSIEESCSAVDAGADYQGRLNAHIRLMFGRAVERELWAGIIAPTNPTAFVNVAAANILGAGGVYSLPGALQAATAALASIGGQGIIHTSSQVADAWAASNMLNDSDRYLRTRADRHYVIGGQGYNDTPPNAAGVYPAGTRWIFTTGMIRVKHSDLSPTVVAFDQRKNTVHGIGRIQAVAWHSPCRMFAIPVNPCDCEC
jgi:hypothetical protein